MACLACSARPTLTRLAGRALCAPHLQIFTERPEVHRAFLAHVPHNMDEKAFWTRYFKQQYRRMARRWAASLSGAHERWLTTREVMKGVAAWWWCGGGLGGGTNLVAEGDN